MARIQGLGDTDQIQQPRPQRPRKRISFGRYESKRSKRVWDEKTEIKRFKTLADNFAERLKARQERERIASTLELDRKAAQLDRQRKAQESREARMEPDFKVEQKPTNPYYELYPDVEERATVQKSLESLPTHVRAIMTLSLDPRDKVPLSTLPEKTRMQVQRARQGDASAVLEMATDSDAIAAMEQAGKDLIQDASKQLARADRKLWATNPDRELVSNFEMTEHEEQIRFQVNQARQRLRGHVNEAMIRKGQTQRGPILGTGEPFEQVGEEVQRPEGTGPQQLDFRLELPGTHEGYDEMTDAQLRERFAATEEKTKKEFFPGEDPNDIRTEYDLDNFQINFYLRDNPLPRTIQMPPLAVEKLHGPEVAADYAVRGATALPEDSPLRSKAPGVAGTFLAVAEMFGFGAPPGAKRDSVTLLDVAKYIGELEVAGWKNFGEVAYKAFDEPRLWVKHNIIEPVLPDFEVKPNIPTAALATPLLLTPPGQLTAAIAVGAIPAAAAAELAIAALDTMHLDTPAHVRDDFHAAAYNTLSNVASKETELTINDELTAEVTSYALDPWNLMPIVGFGETIASISARLALKVAGRDLAEVFAKQGTRAGLRLLQSDAGKAARAILGKDFEFRSMARQALQVLKSEAGQISLGGARAAREAEVKVLEDIVSARETTDEALIPIRKAIDEVLARRIAERKIAEANAFVREAAIKIGRRQPVTPREFRAVQNFAESLGGPRITEAGEPLSFLVNAAWAKEADPTLINSTKSVVGVDGRVVDNIVEHIDGVEALGSERALDDLPGAIEEFIENGDGFFTYTNYVEGSPDAMFVQGRLDKMTDEAKAALEKVAEASGQRVLAFDQSVVRTVEGKPVGERNFITTLDKFKKMSGKAARKRGDLLAKGKLSKSEDDIITRIAAAVDELPPLPAPTKVAGETAFKRVRVGVNSLLVPEHFGAPITAEGGIDPLTRAPMAQWMVKVGDVDVRVTYMGLAKADGFSQIRRFAGELGITPERLDSILSNRWAFDIELPTGPSGELVGRAGLGQFGEMLRLVDELLAMNPGTTASSFVTNPQLARIVKRAGFESFDHPSGGVLSLFDPETLGRRVARKAGGEVKAVAKGIADPDNVLGSMSVDEAFDLVVKLPRVSIIDPSNIEPVTSAAAKRAGVDKVVAAGVVRAGDSPVEKAAAKLINEIQQRGTQQATLFRGELLEGSVVDEIIEAGEVTRDLASATSERAVAEEFTEVGSKLWELDDLGDKVPVIFEIDNARGLKLSDALSDAGLAAERVVKDEVLISGKFKVTSVTDETLEEYLRRSGEVDDVAQSLDDFAAEGIKADDVVMRRLKLEPVDETPKGAVETVDSMAAEEAQKMLDEGQAWLVNDLAREAGGFRFVRTGDDDVGRRIVFKAGKWEGKAAELIERVGERGHAWRVTFEGDTKGVYDGATHIASDIDFVVDESTPIAKSTLAKGRHVKVLDLDGNGPAWGRIQQKFSGTQWSVELEGGQVRTIGADNLKVIPDFPTIEGTVQSLDEARRAMKLKVPPSEKLPPWARDMPADWQMELIRLQDKRANVAPRARGSVTKAINKLKRDKEMYDMYIKQVEGRGGKLTNLSTREGQLAELERLKAARDNATNRLAKDDLNHRIRALTKIVDSSQEGQEAKLVSDAVNEIKQAYLSSRSEELNRALRNVQETKFLLSNRRAQLSPEDIARLEARYKQEWEILANLRKEVDEVAEKIALAARDVEAGRISPRALSIAEVEQWAFGRPALAGRAVRWVGTTLERIPVVGHALSSPIRVIDPTHFYADNLIARKWMATGRLKEQLHVSTKTAENAIRSKVAEMRRAGIWFSRDDAGIEQKTGLPLFDVIEDWEKHKGKFDERLGEFVELLQQTRREALEDYLSLVPEASIDDAWFEATHVFRRALSQHGIDLKQFSRAGRATQPDTLMRRAFEKMADGMKEGVKYDQDIVHVHVSALASIREYGADKAFSNAVKQHGIMREMLTGKKWVLEKQVQTRNMQWAKVALRYAQESLRTPGARPPKPRLRALDTGVAPPDRVVEIVDRIAELNNKTPQATAFAERLRNVSNKKQLEAAAARVQKIAKGTRSPEDVAELELLRAELQEIREFHVDRWLKAREEHSNAVRNLAKVISGDDLKRLGVSRVEELSDDALAGYFRLEAAPRSKFPELSGAMFLSDDIDVLNKLVHPNNAFSVFAKVIHFPTKIIKPLMTAFDPGFWFIQGLLPMAIDTYRVMSAIPRGQLDELITANPLFTPILKPFGKSKSVWGEAIWRSMQGFWNSNDAASYWARQSVEHFDEWQKFAHHARIISGHGDFSDEVVETLVRGGMLEKITQRIPLVNKADPLARVGNSFSNFMDAAAWETWKALSPLADGDAAKLEELGSFVRNLSGRSSARGLGISFGQEMVERSLFFAREYTRASTAIMAKAIFDPTSFGGRQALKSLGGLSMAMTFLVSAYVFGEHIAKNGTNFKKMDWEDLGQDIKNSLIPWRREFMGKRVGDRVVGFGGVIRSNTRFMMRLIKAGYYDYQRLGGPAVLGDETTQYSPSLSPLDFDSKLWVNWDHPAISFFRSKSSPTVGMAWDLISGQDYLGYSVDDPLDFVSYPLPFAIQAYFDAEGKGWQTKVGASTAEFFGLRNIPVNTFTLYKEEVEHTLGMPYEQVQGTALLRAAESDKEVNPKLYELKERVDDEQRKRNNEFQRASDVVDQTKKESLGKVSPLASQIQWGTAGGGVQFRRQLSQHFTTTSNDFNVALTALGIDPNVLTPEEFPNKDKMLEFQYFSLDPTMFVTPDGLEIDWDRFNAAKDLIVAQMSPANQEAILTKRYDVDDPVLAEAMRRKDDAQERLEEYFNAPKYKWLEKEREVEVDQLLEQVDQVRGFAALAGKNVSRTDILEFLMKSGTIDQKIGMIAWLDSKSALRPFVRSTARKEFVFENPDVVVFYPFVFDALDEEEQEDWRAKYQLRQAMIQGTTPFSVESLLGGANPQPGLPGANALESPGGIY